MSYINVTLTKTVSTNARVAVKNTTPGSVKITVETTDLLEDSSTRFFIVFVNLTEKPNGFVFQSGRNYDHYDDYLSLTEEQARFVNNAVTALLAELDTPAVAAHLQQRFKTGTYWRYVGESPSVYGNVYIVSNTNRLVNVKTGAQWLNNRLLDSKQVPVFVQATVEEVVAYLNND